MTITSSLVKSMLGHCNIISGRVADGKVFMLMEALKVLNLWDSTSYFYCPRETMKSYLANELRRALNTDGSVVVVDGIEQATQPILDIIKDAVLGQRADITLICITNEPDVVKRTVADTAYLNKFAVFTV